MANIFNILVLDVIVQLVFIIWTIIEVIKDRHKVKLVLGYLGICLFILTTFSIMDVSLYKDIIHKEKISFEGVYISTDTSINIPVGSTLRYFDTNGNGKEDKYFLDTIFNGSKYNPEEGKKYRVVIYKHSHTIVSLEQIE